MSLGEFDLIDRYFRPGGAARADVVVGIGDDGAVLRPQQNGRMASSMATSGAVSGCPAGDDPELLGREVAAVALNRLAARGVRPAWLTLALTLPEAQSAWLERFSKALLGLAHEHGATLVGGDTTRGPLNVTVTAHGMGDVHAAATARGDALYVTGHLGDGLLALAHRKGTAALAAARRRALHRRLRARAPRIEPAMAVAALGAVARDTSAGLEQALRSLAGGALGARVACHDLPLAPDLERALPSAGGWPALLRAEGDVELCIAAAPGAHRRLLAACARHGLACTRIGELGDGDGVVLEEGAEDSRP